MVSFLASVALLKPVLHSFLHQCQRLGIVRDDVEAKVEERGQRDAPGRPGCLVKVGSIVEHGYLQHSG